MYPFNIKPRQHKYSIGVIIVVLATGLLGGCATSSPSLLPEIKSAQIGSVSFDNTSSAKVALAQELSPKLPAMTAREHEGLGDRLMARGQLHSAFLHYEKALQFAPDNLGLEYKKGLTLLKGGKTDEATKQFRFVLSKDPQHARAREGIGRAFFIKGDTAASKPHFLKAIALDDKLWLSHNYLGAIYDRQRQWNEALEAYQAAIDLRPREGSLYNNLGMSHLMAGQYAAAVTSFQNAITKGFTASKVYNNLGVALAHLDYNDAAFEAFAKAGGQAQAYNNLGCIYLQKKQRQKAIACFEKAIAMEPVYYVKASENLKRAKMAGEQL